MVSFLRSGSGRLRRLVAAGLSSLACLSAAAAAAADPAYTLAVARSPLALSVHVALAKGYFAAEGLSVRRIECPTGRRCLKHLTDGEADFATAGDIPIVFASFESNSFAVLATVASTTQDAKIVTRRSVVSRPADLVGRRVGVVRSTSAHYYLDSFLLFHGIDPQRVELVNLQVEDAVNELQAGRIDALAVFEPLAYRAAQALGLEAFVLPNPGVYIQTFNLLAQRRHTGAAQRDLVAMLRALRRAQAFVREHPQDAKAMLNDWLRIDAGFAEWSWKPRHASLTLDQSLVKTLESEARWALREGYVKGGAAPNYLGFVHMAPLQALDPDAVGLAH